MRVPGCLDERVDERTPLVLFARCREQLLELVDGEHEPLARRNALERGAELGRRSLARTDEHAFRPEGRQQTGTKERRLAAAGCPDNREQRRVREPRHHLVHESLTAEEELRVFGLEWGEPLERADVPERTRRAPAAVDGEAQSGILDEDRPL